MIKSAIQSGSWITTNLPQEDFYKTVFVENTLDEILEMLNA
jgi:hypothetical protein